MPDRHKINVAVSTVYDSLSSDAIDCAQFVIALEEGLSVLPGFSVGQVGIEDHFFVHLGFAEIDDQLRAVSVVVGFHAIEPLSQPSEIDYFLRQYTGHFIARPRGGRGYHVSGGGLRGNYQTCRAGLVGAVGNMPRSRKINREKVQASLDKTCPKCGLHHCASSGQAGGSLI